MKRILCSSEQDKLLFKTLWIPGESLTSIGTILINNNNRIFMWKKKTQINKNYTLSMQINVARTSENMTTEF